MNKIFLGDHISLITDYHANGAYEKLKDNIKLKYEDDYAIMVRTLNFESKNFTDNLIYLNETEYNYLKKSKVYHNDLIMNKIANAGNVYLMPKIKKPVSLAMNLFLIRFKETVNPVYMFYIMKLNESYIKKFAKGTTTKTITKDAVRELEFTIHNLNEQNLIARFVRNIDDKIELNNQINTELEAMAKTLYDYWFVQFDFPDENGKPYKSSGGKMVFNEVLKREIPIGWEVKNIFNCAKVQYGFPFSTKYFNTEKVGTPVIRIRDILENTISNFSNEPNIDQKYLIKKGDLLVGMDGNFHINYWTKDDCYLNQRVVMIKKKNIPNMIIKYQVEPYIKLREKSVSRTTVGHLSDKDLKRLEILIPSKELSNKSKNLFDSFLEKIIINQRQNQELAQLRDWLLPMLMNGQVRVGSGEYERDEGGLGMVAE